jgi:spectinomycin phosphotransferase
LGVRVREAPEGLDQEALLSVIQRQWTAEIDAVEHLPVGFGAHHWVATIKGRPTQFVTLDTVDGKHDAASLEAAYAVASGLMFPLDFVVAPVPSHAGSFTLPFAHGVVSVTPWVSGDNPDGIDLDAVARMLRRLHAVSPPSGIPRWTTITPPSLPADLSELCRTPWSEGPYGERARSAIRARLDAIAEWSDAYHALAGLAHRRPWVITHGEPGEHNLMLAVDKLLLVDWETVRLAPAERDWRTLVERGLRVEDVDAAMLDLFDLEWRLDEISQYAAWFASPHTGSASDRVAIGGLLHELTRSSFQHSGS